MVFEFQDRLWSSQPRAMFFGATSVVYAWHRVGHVLAWQVICQGRCAVIWYVDVFSALRARACVGTAGGCLRWYGPS